MSLPSLSHAIFKIERVIEAPLALAFHVFTDNESRKRWYLGAGGWGVHSFSAPDSIVTGAVEKGSFSPPYSTVILTNTSYYLEVIKEKLLVYTYTMEIEGTPVSSSLMSVEFLPHRSGTRIIITVQGAYRDKNIGSRKHGMIEMIESFAREAARQNTQ